MWTDPAAGLNAPYGARCFLTGVRRRPQGFLPRARLNAPYGARCFLTSRLLADGVLRVQGLNAPYGARCFLTQVTMRFSQEVQWAGLNAPYGARCFLTTDNVLVTGLG